MVCQISTRLQSQKCYLHTQYVTTDSRFGLPCEKRKEKKKLCPPYIPDTVQAEELFTHWLSGSPEHLLLQTTEPALRSPLFLLLL